MESPDLKLLKKLADACRKAGIRTFKGYGFEFTLEDAAPPSAYKSKKAKKNNSLEDSAIQHIDTDSLSDEALLFWSVNNPEESQDNAQ